MNDELMDLCVHVSYPQPFQSTVTKVYSQVYGACCTATPLMLGRYLPRTTHGDTMHTSGQYCLGDSLCSLSVVST